jgi:hypothetical protein
MSLLVSIGQKLTPKNVTLGVIATNMVCRPTITMSNKSIPDETRRYTATREFFTEFFGAITTFTFATYIGEKLMPKLAAKKWGVNLTKELADKINKTDWASLTDPVHKNLKATKVLSSFATTAVAVAILTPILNNLVLNKLINKIMKPKTSAESGQQQQAQPQGTYGLILPAGGLTQNGVPHSNAFERFLQTKLQQPDNLNRIG